LEPAVRGEGLAVLLGVAVVAAGDRVTGDLEPADGALRHDLAPLVEHPQAYPRVRAADRYVPVLVGVFGRVEPAVDHSGRGLGHAPPGVHRGLWQPERGEQGQEPAGHPGLDALAAVHDVA